MGDDDGRPDMGNRDPNNLNDNLLVCTDMCFATEMARALSGSSRSNIIILYTRLQLYIQHVRLTN